MKTASLAASLLAWYDVSGRDLPWRSKNCGSISPYQVWLSEIMLQQTTVKTVEPYFEKFIDRWPTLLLFAKASQDEVLHAWQGLGYYARARNMLRCAQKIISSYGGVFPDKEDELLKLPGIGSYTAAAISAIAFNQPATVIDGNVERVISRLRMVEEPLPHAKIAIKKFAQEITPVDRSGDYAQAIMDLGATICRPKTPLCTECPWQSSCLASHCGKATQFPRRAEKKQRPTRYGLIFYVLRRDKKFLVYRRAEKGIYGGLVEVPTSEWTKTRDVNHHSAVNFPVHAEWESLPYTIRHDFTHFRLELNIVKTEIDGRVLKSGIWCTTDEFLKYASSTLSKKIVECIKLQN